MDFTPFDNDKRAIAPNGTALSCGADNFQLAENETSSC